MNFARWVLLDYGDIVIHIFDRETRAFYDLEKFWMDAPRIPAGESPLRDTGDKKISGNLI